MDLELSGITKRFGGQTVLDRISFRLQQPELVSIIGPSGVGKTTLLKIIAQLDRQDRGQVSFSRPVNKKNPVILVFQDYVLFPNMTVWDNVAFGLRARKAGKLDIRDRVQQMLDYFHLQAQSGHCPAQLSAGQRQRVAIARAMVINPAVLLLDEPFANLDRNLKMETARFIRRTQKEFGIPTISVTHDLEEAFAMSDKIGILLNGALKQFDTPRQIYFSPNSYEVASFLGPVNTIPKSLYPFLGLGNSIQVRDEIFARPETLSMTADDQGPARVVDVSFAGHYIVYSVQLEGTVLTVYCQNESFPVGQRVRLNLKTLNRGDQAQTWTPSSMLAMDCKKKASAEKFKA